MRLITLLSTILLGVGAVVGNPLKPRADGKLTLVKNKAEFTFDYSTPTANAKNWIGIYHASGGGPDNEKQDQPSLRWKYAPKSKGTITIDAPVGARGKYKAYFLANDGYKWLANPIEITASGKGDSNPGELKVMTYNLWHGGEKVNNYHEKQVAFLSAQNPDIIGFQEATRGHGKRLGEALGWNWHQTDDQRSVAIISRHRIVTRHTDTKAASGVEIHVDGNKSKAINFWSAHLSAYPYGPYEFCFEGKSADEVTAGEESAGRTPQIKEVVEKTKGQISGSKPFVLVGDFNAPSHLDWTATTKGSHCGVSFKWPTSRIPSDAGLADSFRVAHPDPKAQSGNTWSPIYKQNEDEGKAEPQDRIDFIYHNKGMEVLRSETKVAGRPKEMPNHEDNEWTSDHAVVVTTYEMP